MTSLKIDTLESLIQAVRDKKLYHESADSKEGDLVEGFSPVPWRAEAITAEAFRMDILDFESTTWEDGTAEVNSLMEAKPQEHYEKPTEKPTAEVDETLWEEICKLFPATRPELPHVCGKIDGDITVSLEDGAKIRIMSRAGKAKSNRGDEDFMDFVDAGNGEEDPGLCGKKEIVIDGLTDPSEWKFNCYHEAVERRHMAKGMAYNDAHEIANKQERVLRKKADAKGK